MDGLSAFATVLTIVEISTKVVTRAVKFARSSPGADARNLELVATQALQSLARLRSYETCKTKIDAQLLDHCRLAAKDLSTLSVQIKTTFQRTHRMCKIFKAVQVDLTLQPQIDESLIRLQLFQQQIQWYV